MDAGFRILERGVIYIDAGKIAAVKPAGEPPPEGFKGCPLIRTGDTIYPGLIELHNHLSYNILPIWQVPKQYANRSQWGRHPDYRKLISGPMGVLGRTKGYVEAIVRYVECKCLLGGVTTSQGIALFSNAGIRKYYRGIIRNVEETNDDALPEAGTKISDVEAKDAAKFLGRLEKSTCLLLHLSEGIDERAHQHFEALHLPDGTWAITPALSGIHSAALHAEDFQTMQEHGGSMIWSPLSNYLLYGDTADIEAARDAGVLIGIGSDWSPSGSKNLLGELKVAHLVSQEQGGVFTNRQLLAMATTNAAKILKWEKAIGSIEAGKRADLLVLNGRRGDPYDHLIDSRETSVTLVVINGVPRYGQKRLMKRFGDGGEEWTVGQSKRVLNLKQETADSIVGALTLRQACDRLSDGLQRLGELALEEESTAAALASGAIQPPTEETWSLELEHDDPGGTSQRPHLPLAATGEFTGMLEPLDFFTAGVPLSELLEPVELDEIAVEDDPEFFERLALQLNLPNFIKTGLPPLYGKKPAVPKSASFVKKANEAVKSQLETTTDLPTFLKMAGELTLEDRQLLVGQALLLLEQAYVHLPLKRSMHAVDPIQRLKLLQYRLSQLSGDRLPPEIQFHNEMTDIFTSLRDLHTNYLLPAPFKDKVAYLPFLVEECYQDGEPKYIVSKLIGGLKHDTFKPGVEILYWNGIPIRKAIEINAARQAGSNAAARFGRGLSALTVRPMVRMLPPDEEWVTITYRSSGGKELEFKQDWLIFSPDRSGGIDPDSVKDKGVTALGFDLQADVTNQAKKVLFVPKAVAAQKEMAKRARPLAATESTMPTVFYHKAVATKHGKFGYIRIFTFNVPDADEFVDEFVRLAKSLPQNGLIVDVRGNGGGLIYAAERLLQVLTPRHIAPERAQFITTPLVLDICRRHAPSPLSPDFDLKPWIESIEQAVETGATYSQGHPITDEDSCNERGQKYQGPVLLITDALCYSATDIFAAGFQDHKIGPILGVHGNTGAGGANVWTHRLLRTLTGDAESPFKPLPNGAGMRVAIRQTLRVGERAGLPIEDLGVVPDFVHEMTRDDTLKGNVDLIEHAGEILSQGKRYTLSAEVESISDRGLKFKVKTQNLSRLDVYLDWRPQQSLDVEDGTSQLKIQPSSPGAARLRLLGYDGEKLAAACSRELRWPRS